MLIPSLAGVLFISPSVASSHTFCVGILAAFLIFSTNSISLPYSPSRNFFMRSISCHAACILATSSSRSLLVSALFPSAVARSVSALFRASSFVCLSVSALFRASSFVCRCCSFSFLAFSVLFRFFSAATRVFSASLRFRSSSSTPRMFSNRTDTSLKVA